MREIKFRAKRIDNSEWAYGSLLQSEIDVNQRFVKCQIHVPFADNFSIAVHDVFPETVGECTGLKDKNNVEIYEGDICKVLYTDWMSKPYNDERTIDQYLFDISLTGIVKYEFNGFFFVEDIEDGYPNTMNVGKYGRIQVIGNIHQTPELLK